MSSIKHELQCRDDDDDDDDEGSEEWVYLELVFGKGFREKDFERASKSIDEGGWIGTQVNYEHDSKRFIGRIVSCRPGRKDPTAMIYVVKVHKETAKRYNLTSNVMDCD